MSDVPKSFEEHCDFLARIARLKLWFVYRWLQSHPDQGLIPVLRWRVDIFRKTVFWRRRGFPTDEDFQVPGWLALERQVEQVYEETRLDGTISAFEQQAFDLVWAAVEANVRYDYHASLAVDKGFQCDSLGYDPPSAQEPGRVFVHITNALQPRSILDDARYLAGCFVCLMDRAEAEYGADSLGTSTWLNSYPRWLAFFPPEYYEHMGAEEQVWCGLGSWGQFVNARGTFNEKHARFLRETGCMPYPKRYSWCSFAALREHLQRSS